MKKFQVVLKRPLLLKLFLKNIIGKILGSQQIKKIMENCFKNCPSVPLNILFPDEKVEKTEKLVNVGKRIQPHISSHNLKLTNYLFW